MSRTVLPCAAKSAETSGACAPEASIFAMSPRSELICPVRLALDAGAFPWSGSPPPVLAPPAPPTGGVVVPPPPTTGGFGGTGGSGGATGGFGGAGGVVVVVVV